VKSVSVSISSKSAASGSSCWEKPSKVISVAFGYDNAAATVTQPMAFFMDDFAVDDKRVGCP